MVHCKVEVSAVFLMGVSYSFGNDVVLKSGIEEHFKISTGSLPWQDVIRFSRLLLFSLLMFVSHNNPRFSHVSPSWPLPNIVKDYGMLDISSSSCFSRTLTHSPLLANLILFSSSSSSSFFLSHNWNLTNCLLVTQILSSFSSILHFLSF